MNLLKEGRNKMNTRIATIRKKEDLNQEEFASSLGLTKNFISLVETGKREPSDRTINDICRIYNVNENWLRTGEGEMLIPMDREKELALLTAKLFKESSDSFKNRFVSMLAKMSDDEWALLESTVDKLAQKK
jgi:transcriptional regulator with XRE-family HTH domain